MMKIEKRKDGWKVCLSDSTDPDWVDFATHDTELSAANHLAKIEKVANKEGSVHFAWHPAKKAIYVYHTAMFRMGFADRNAQAKGFLSTFLVATRPATIFDEAYFLATYRSTWQEYKAIGPLIADERKFCPAETDRIESEIRAFKSLSPAFLTGQMSLLADSIAGPEFYV